MIYTTKENESFDAEILRTELVKVIGADGWYINTAGNTVEFCVVGTESSIHSGEFEPVILAHFANGETRDHNKAILKQITELEATQTPRRIREGGQWMIDLEAQIAALRSQLQ